MCWRWLGAVDDYSTPTGEEVMPSIYSCPAGEYPGLIKFAVHEGAVTTADDRWVAVGMWSARHPSR